ncbi:MULTISPECIES: hypothetical protein [Actinosynnema]|uniref:hypothetical protein n=1 Tax=Actinosynnema TaxID=40566 RepID=UPI0020A2637B|nr:hypothetical protein [Actinosynnema pretiosum]MCP2097319.1 hypothetical protein [Actinosynnema pretiosum]
MSVTHEVGEDVLAMVEHVLRTREVDNTRYGPRGLGEHTAREAARALADAGLLHPAPRREVPPELTAEQAKLLVLRGLADRRDRIVVAQAGVLLLTWSTAVRAYLLVDQHGTHFQGADHAQAAAAFTALARDGGRASG